MVRHDEVRVRRERLRNGLFGDVENEVNSLYWRTRRTDHEAD
jgi:hypothetical protein